MGNTCPWGREKPFAEFWNVLYLKTWYVWMGVRLSNARFTTQYIGRYTKRPVLAQSRIKDYDGEYVTFEYEDKTEGQERKPLRMSVEMFIARLVVHIHDKHFRAIRHYGFYATRTRKEDIAWARKLLHEAAKPEVIPMNWQQRRKLSTGYDPLICHRCKVPLTLVAVAYRSRDGPLKERTFDN